MFSEDDFVYGARKYGKKFDKFGEMASSLFGTISQCGVVEVNRSGETLVACNRLDFNEVYFDSKSYLADDLYTFADDTRVGVFTFDASYDLTLLFADKKFTGKKLDILHGFYYTEKVDNNTFRHYGFASNTQDVYKNLIKNYYLFETFIKYFMNETKEILIGLDERKVDMSVVKGNNYFQNPHGEKESKKEMFTKMLRKNRLLGKDTTLSNREYQCMGLYCKGYSSKLTGEILKISNRTVESHINSLKNKLAFSKRDELLERLC